MLLSVLRGGRVVPSPLDITQCGAAYFLIDLAMLVSAYYFYRYIERQILKEENEKSKSN
jgi:hypothetical protein